MTKPIPINIAIEDLLTEVVIEVLLEQSEKTFFVGRRYSRNGYGYLRRTISGFNNASKSTPFLVVTDLDSAECPASLKADWLGRVAEHPNLLFRVAVREVESWVMADRGAFSKFLGVSIERIPSDLDAVPDPKALLVKIAGGSRQASIRRDLVPRATIGRTVGPGYNARLTEFVRSKWRASAGIKHSDSLERAFARVNEFSPTWQR